MTDGTQTAESTLKPFHESVVDAINRADSIPTMYALGDLIRSTKIPKNHDNIIGAVGARVTALGMSEDFRFWLCKAIEEQKPTESAAEQKETVTA